MSVLLTDYDLNHKSKQNLAYSFCQFRQQKRSVDYDTPFLVNSNNYFFAGGGVAGAVGFGAGAVGFGAGVAGAVIPAFPFAASTF